MEATKDQELRKAIYRQLPEEEVAHLDKPQLIWDGKCGFCYYWVTRWAAMTRDAVTYKTYQEAGSQFPNIPEEAFRRAAFLIEPDGEVYRGIGAAYRTFTYGSRWGFLFRLYQYSALFRNASDALYRWIANHRPLMFRVTKLLWGKNPRNPKLYWLVYLLLLALVSFLIVY